MALRRLTIDAVHHRVDYSALADLRYQMRRFLRVREIAARAVAVEPQQYLLLLQVKGAEGRQRSTIGALAERLQLRHHSVVQLVDRLAERGMVERRRDSSDRREVVVALRPAGEKLLAQLARYSVDELIVEGPALVALLKRLVSRSQRGSMMSRNGSRKSSAMKRRTVSTARPTRRIRGT